jgi:hypothetical protein
MLFSVLAIQRKILDNTTGQPIVETQSAIINKWMIFTSFSMILIVIPLQPLLEALLKSKQRVKLIIYSQMCWG